MEDITKILQKQVEGMSLSEKITYMDGYKAGMNYARSIFVEENISQPSPDDCVECGKEHNPNISCLEAGAIRLNV